MFEESPRGLANEDWKSIVHAQFRTRRRIPWKGKEAGRIYSIEILPRQTFVGFVMDIRRTHTALVRLRSSSSYHRRKFLNRKDVINRRGTKAERRSGKAAATEAFTLAGVERL